MARFWLLPLRVLWVYALCYDTFEVFHVLETLYGTLGARNAGNAGGARGIESSGDLLSARVAARIGLYLVHGILI